MILHRWLGFIVLLAVLTRLVDGLTPAPSAPPGLARPHAPTPSSHVLLDALLPPPRHWLDDDAGMARCLAGVSGKDLIEDPAWLARILLCHDATPCAACRGPSGHAHTEEPDRPADLSTWEQPGLERHALSIGAPVPPYLRQEGLDVWKPLATTEFFIRPPHQVAHVKSRAWPASWQPEGVARADRPNQP